MRTALIVAIASIVVITPASALANQCVGADGSFGFKDRFSINEIVYITGDFDTSTAHIVCGDGDIYIIPSEQEALVPDEDATLGGPNYFTGCTLGGGFFDAPVWLPDLTPGVYDCVIDENLNGVFDPGIDYRGQRAILVRNVRTGVNIDVAAFKATARALQASWLELGEGWEAVSHLYNALGCVGFPGGLFGYAVCFIASDVFGVAFNYNDVVFSTGSKIITGIAAAEAHKFGDIAADPPDPNFRAFSTPTLASTTMDLQQIDLEESYPFEPALPLQSDLMNRAVANHGVNQSALLEAILPTLERIQGAEVGGVEGEDNLFVYLQAAHLRRLSSVLSHSAEQASTLALRWRTDLDERGVQSPEFPSAHFGALQTQLRTSDFSPEQRAALEGQGLGDADIQTLGARVLALTNVEEGTSTHTLLTELEETLGETKAFADALVAQADRLMEAQRPYANHTLPTVDAGGPYSGVAGEPISLAATSAHPAMAARWDLNLDGVFDDAQGLETSFTSDAAGVRLVAVEAAASDGTTLRSVALVSVAPANLPPEITSFSPEGAEETSAGPGDPVAFSATFTDPDGDALTAVWTVDGVEAGRGPAMTYAPTAPLGGPTLVKLTVSDARSAPVEAWRTVFPTSEATPDPDMDAGSEGDSGEGQDTGSDAGRADVTEADSAEGDDVVAPDLPDDAEGSDSPQDEGEMGSSASRSTEGGCACRSSTGRDPGTAPLVALGLGLAFVAWRRQRAR